MLYTITIEYIILDARSYIITYYGIIYNNGYPTKTFSASGRIMCTSKYIGDLLL